MTTRIPRRGKHLQADLQIWTTEAAGRSDPAPAERIWRLPQQAAHPDRPDARQYIVGIGVGGPTHVVKLIPR